MFDYTQDELDIFALFTKLNETYKEMQQRHDIALRALPWEARHAAANPAVEGGFTPEQIEVRRPFEEAKAELESLRKEINQLSTSELFLRYGLKTDLNKKVVEALPGGSGEAVLAIVEESVAKLDGPTVTRVMLLLKDLLIRGFNMAADAEVNEARAKGTKARFDALVKVGLPETLVVQIIVAEVSRPWPTISNPKAK